MMIIVDMIIMAIKVILITVHKMYLLEFLTMTHLRRNSGPAIPLMAILMRFIDFEELPFDSYGEKYIYTCLHLSRWTFKR